MNVDTQQSGKVLSYSLVVCWWVGVVIILMYFALLILLIVFGYLLVWMISLLVN